MSLDLSEPATKSLGIISEQGPLFACLVFVIIILLIAIATLWFALQGANKDARESYKDFLNLSVDLKLILERVGK